MATPPARVQTQFNGRAKSDSRNNQPELPSWRALGKFVPIAGAVFRTQSQHIIQFAEACWAQTSRGDECKVEKRGRKRTESIPQMSLLHLSRCFPRLLCASQLDDD